MAYRLTFWRHGEQDALYFETLADAQTIVDWFSKSQAASGLSLVEDKLGTFQGRVTTSVKTQMESHEQRLTKLEQEVLRLQSFTRPIGGA